MSALAPATPCYLVGHVEMPALNGRAVEIQRRVLDEAEEVYEVAASWVQHAFPGSEVHTARRNLLPLIPPERVYQEHEHSLALWKGAN